jgi:hypothetical protein
MNFYLAAIDDLLRHPDDRPSIGLIICKTKTKSLQNTLSGTRQRRSAFPNTGWPNLSPRI